jgi:NADP-dependent 3-hydroxy acid dehydrogenase YdfG
MKRLEGQVAIVTGGSRGIGRATALALAQEGASVVITARTKPELELVAKEIHQLGAQVIPLKVDLTSDDQVWTLVDETMKRFGRIDILVNNAGMGVFKPFVEMGTAEFDAMWRLNMRTPFVLTKLVLPHMIKQSRGAIVNIASLAGKNSFVNGTGYAATKWALRGWASSLMLEVRRHNIRVVTIFPGSVDTTFSTINRRGEAITQPEDVANAVVFAVTAPTRSMFSEIDVRPTNPT